MKSILEELWYGNICPSMRCVEATDKSKQLIEYIAKHHNDLSSTLTEQQKEILEKFNDCSCELMDINEREIFLYAFRLGMRIAIEVLSPFSNQRNE